MTKWSMCPSKVPLSEWTSKFHWGYLQVYVWRVTYRSTNTSKPAETPKPIPTWVTAHRRWKPRAYSTTHKQLKSFKCHFQATEFGLCLSSYFQAVQLVWECFSAIPTTYMYLGRRALMNLVSFRDFHKLPTVYFLSFSIFLEVWVF